MTLQTKGLWHKTLMPDYIFIFKVSESVSKLGVEVPDKRLPSREETYKIFQELQLNKKRHSWTFWTMKPQYLPTRADMMRQQSRKVKWNPKALHEVAQGLYRNNCLLNWTEFGRGCLIGFDLFLNWIQWTRVCPYTTLKLCSESINMYSGRILCFLGPLYSNYCMPARALAASGQN